MVIFYPTNGKTSCLEDLGPTADVGKLSSTDEFTKSYVNQNMDAASRKFLYS
jgi:hypothetical protein